MKRIFQLTACLFFFNMAISQNYKPLSKDFTPPASKHIDAAQVNQLRQSFSSTSSHSRGGGSSMVLDYDYVDALECTGFYDQFIWELHSQFPDDSTYENNYNWTAVSFDTLYDAITSIPTPYATAQVTIDSIVVFGAHENFTGTQDAIVISVLDYVPGASATIVNGLQTNAQQTTILNNVIYADTIFTTTSITPGLLNLAGFTIRPNLTLAVGQKFLVSVHFYGSLNNDFYFLAGYCDICNQGCLSEASVFQDNTISRRILWQQGASNSGVDNFLFYPCNRTPPPNNAVPGNCESWYVQNSVIQAFVTVNSASGSGCTPPAATGTPGFTPQYNSLPCTEQGIAYSQTVNFENFTSIASPFGPITMNSLKIDSITNLPCNLTWQTNKPTNTFIGGEVGCIDITGTTNDTTGQYDWEMYITTQVTIPGIGAQSFNGEVKALITQLAGFGITLPANLVYYIRVKAPAGACPNVNTGIAGNTACSGGSVQPPDSCDILANVDSLDNPSLYGNVSGGYTVGHNGDGFPAFAEYFSNSVNGTIPTVTFFFGDAMFGNANSKITATIWTVSGTPDFYGNPNRPGTVLATEDILISDIANDVANGFFTAVTFSTPAAVTGNFYAGFQVTHAAGDTVGLVTNDDGESVPATMMVSVANFVPGEWARIDSLFGGFSVSGYIFPEVCGQSVPCPTITVTTNFSNATCTASNGSAGASASGGTPPYTYNWGGGQTGTSISNLAPGPYAVLATDSNGCTGNAVVVVGSNVVTLSVSATPTMNTSCTPPNGTATATVSGGTYPYTYIWTANASGQNDSTATVLVGGNYSVTVTDANGCSGTASAIVATTTISVNVNIAVSNVTSCISDNGALNVTASGGSGNYTYLWSQGAQTTQGISGLAPGNYTVTVTDIPSSCFGIASATVADSTGNLSVVVSATDASSGAATDGTASATASGGSGSYTYDWSNLTSGQTITGLAPGTYRVTVIDNIFQGCTVTDSVVVGFPVGTAAVNSGYDVSIFPNPTTGKINLKMEFNGTVSVKTEWYNILGEKIFKEEAVNVNSINKEYELSSFAEGIYFVRVTFGNEMIIKRVSVSR